MILNDYYVSDLNTYKSGVITYPLNGLSEGRHHLTLKVWDVYNNSSEAVISFVVSGDDRYDMLNLYNYPNPFKTTTTFSFETNRTNAEVDIELLIFNMYGRRVKTISKTAYISGYRAEPVTWDGTDDSGSKCTAGMYVYRLIATMPDGTQATETAKLVLLNDASN
jgi:flagellar hook assembly protein FlgD